MKPVEPSLRDYSDRELTTTTFTDRASLLEFIVGAYLDADGAGACATLTVHGHECPLIIGPVPAWVRTDKVEITAQWSAESLPAEALDRLKAFRFTRSIRRNLYPPEIQLMLQGLLEKAFELTVRRERRDVPVWVITRRTQEPSLAYSASTEGGLVVATRRAPAAREDRVELVFEGSTLADAADFFSFYLDRPVIDRTGVRGSYNFTLGFRGGDGAAQLKKGGSPVMAGFDVGRLAMAFDGLGFDVGSTTAPFDVLIIEHVQRLSLN